MKWNIYEIENMHDNVNMLLKGIKISRPRTKIADQIQWKCIVTKWSNYAITNKHVLVNVQSVFV